VSFVVISFLNNQGHEGPSAGVARVAHSQEKNLATDEHGLSTDGGGIAFVQIRVSSVFIRG
jgi:hypothetical protein